MQFNDKLYIGNIWSGGLYALTEDFELEGPLKKGHVGFGRAHHSATDKIVIGKYIIDSEENITNTGKNFAAVCSPPSAIADPDKYFLGESGEKLWRIDMENESVTLESDALAEMDWGIGSIGDYVFAPVRDTNSANRGLWRYDGANWTRLADEQFQEAYSTTGAPNTLYAAGYDLKSTIFYWTKDGTTLNRYRFPVAFSGSRTVTMSSNFRMRLCQGFSVLAHIGGILYNLPAHVNPWGTDALVPQGIKPEPICRTRYRIFDFANFRGLLGVAREENFPMAPRSTGQPQSGLDFYRRPQLNNWGEPKGWGGVWNGDSVSAGETSDPFLINGFDQKTIHLETDTATDYTIQVDPIGDGSWKDYDTVSFSGSGYDTYIMTGDAVWVRIKSSDAVTATAWLNVG